MQPNPTRNQIIAMIDTRIAHLREELADARSVGVDTPGFNQILGAMDELTFLRDEITDAT